nr:beta-ketoacyl synthase chain length factor [Caldimonas mangrovi]
MNKPDDWLAWSARARLPHGDDAPALPEIAAMMRRRLSTLGRMALQASWWCQGDRPAMPTVFASRYGDVDRSLQLLADLERDGSVSPTGFTMSVHNAISGLYSIVREDRSNAVCVAAGQATAAAGVTEAAGLLADGAGEVMLVCYDEPLPDDYVCFRDEPQARWAWAWRLAPARAGHPRWSLASRPVPAEVRGAPAELPAGLEVLRFFLAEEARLTQHAGTVEWEWRRHG